MRIIALILMLLMGVACSAGATPPSITRTIDPTIKTWSEDWTSNTWWVTYNPNTFAASNLYSDGTLSGYLRTTGGGTPQKRWDKNKPITAYHKVRITGGSGWNFIFYGGESEYWGFVSSGSSVSYYCNAEYYSANVSSFDFTYNQVFELQMEFDGNQTTTLKARNLGAANWVTVGVYTFKPKVHPSLQINAWGASTDRGQIKVTGSEVWQTSDVPDRPYWLPVKSDNYCLELGIEWELSSQTDRGVQHFLTHAGGHTIQASEDKWGNGGYVTWDQRPEAPDNDTTYSTGTFWYQSTIINPASGFKYGQLDLIGGLRSGGAGSSLSVSILKPDGTLVPSSELKGAANPVAFTSVLAEVKTVDLSDIPYTGIYLEINGNSPNVTTHVSPTTTTNEGMTGPPILKQAAVTFVASGDTGSPGTTRLNLARSGQRLQLMRGGQRLVLKR